MINPNAIKSISVYRLELPFSALGSLWLERQAPQYLDTTLIVLETQSGLTGIGESCPLGEVYLPAFAGGLRAAIAELAPALLGQDATQINHIYRLMNDALYGHNYAKAAIDIACWDLLGKHCAQPISALLGGRFQSKLPVYTSIPLDAADTMRLTLKRKQKEGYTRFQIKIGGDPVRDCERIQSVIGARRQKDVFMADANRGWSQAAAMRVVETLNRLDCYLEQPCATYRECMVLRQHCNLPIILDEVIDNPQQLVRAIAAGALDALVIKLTHAGGLTPAKILRDICVAQGIEMRIEDTAGTVITRAAQAQLAAATPLHTQLGCYSFFSDSEPAAEGAPEIHEGWLYLNDEPGLGVAPRMDVLGSPIAVYG